MINFVPSNKLTKLLVGGLFVENTEQVTREEIPNFLGNMCLATIGDGIEEVGGCVDLCDESGDFLAGVGKMIIFRMGLNRLFISKKRKSMDELFYPEEIEFLNLLAEELRDYVKDHKFGNGRNRLEVVNNRLVVRKFKADPPPKPRDPCFEKAKIVRLVQD